MSYLFPVAELCLIEVFVGIGYMRSNCARVGIATGQGSDFHTYGFGSGCGRYAVPENAGMEILGGDGAGVETCTGGLRIG